MNRIDLAQCLDHAVLAPTATAVDVQEACALARLEAVASLCVSPSRVEQAVASLEGSAVPVGTVIGFPAGATASTVKVAEVATALAQGATEFDVVLALGALKDGRGDVVRDDLKGVVAAAEGRIVKVILETAYLDEAEILLACRWTEEAGAAFVKTSTGFGPSGATTHDVALMKEAVGCRLKVKASAGIRDLNTALAMLDAGADRLGTSSTLAILDELSARVEKEKIE